MPTHKQKQAVKRIIENRGNVSKSMREVGYTDATAKNPSNLTSSKGFLQLADEAGLTEEFLLECLEDDIRAKPRRRTEELKLAGKWRGLERQDLHVTIEQVDVPDDVFNDLIARVK